MEKTNFWCLLNNNTQKLIKGLFFDEARAIVLSVAKEEQIHWFAWKEGWEQWKPVTQVVGLCEPFVRNMTSDVPVFASEGYSSQQVSDSSHKHVPREFEYDMSDEESLFLEEGQLSEFNKIQGPTDMTVMAGKELSGSGFFELLENGEKTIKDDIIQLNEDPNHVYIEREFKRYSKGFEILIVHAGQIYKSKTLDISVGGLLLKDPLPATIAGYFKVKILHPQNDQQVELTCCLVENQDPKARYRVSFLPLKNPDDQDALENWIKAA